MISLNIILIILICVVSYYVWNYCRQIFATKKVIDLPIVKKTMKNYLRGTSDEILDILNMLGRFYPSSFQMRLGNQIFIVTYESSEVKAILQSRHCLDRSTFSKFVEPLFGMGLLTAPESIWNKNRKIIASNFSLNTLQGFFDIFVKQSLILTNKLQEIGMGNNQIILFKHIATCALDIVCDTMVGIKMKPNQKDQYFKAMTRLKEILKYRLYVTWIENNLLFYNFIFNLTAFGREQKKNIKLLNSLMNELQQQHELNKLNTTKTETDTNHETFFDILMESPRKKKFTQKIIRDNVIMMIPKATDTISVTLDFVIFMLANFPEIQEKVYKELSEIYGMETSTSAPVKYDDLQHMHYLDRVINETIRLFPTMPIINRQLTEDMRVGDSILPKNTNILIPLILMNRKENYWPNPLKFDPDRFLPERIKECPSCYHIPFSSGPRDCIGQKYAIISIKVILAILVRTFIFKVNESISIDKIKLKMDVTLSPIEPLKVIIKKRDL